MRASACTTHRRCQPERQRGAPTHARAWTSALAESLEVSDACAGPTSQLAAGGPWDQAPKSGMVMMKRTIGGNRPPLCYPRRRPGWGRPEQHGGTSEEGRVAVREPPTICRKRAASPRSEGGAGNVPRWFSGDLGNVAPKSQVRTPGADGRWPAARCGVWADQDRGSGGGRPQMVRPGGPGSGVRRRNPQLGPSMVPERLSRPR